jgi:hypothetical protein
MSSIECKACGLINPPSATKCECGQQLGSNVGVKATPPNHVLGLLGIALMLSGSILLGNPTITSDSSVANLQMMFVGMQHLLITVMRITS